jgi:hypothetical protein
MSHYHHMGAVTSSVPFVDTPTAEGDGFKALLAAYKSAFPVGTSERDFAKAVCAANGIPYTVTAIERWIFGLSGKRHPFSAKENPGMYGGPKNVGYSYFGAGNRIKLPNIPRPGVNPPAGSPPVDPVLPVDLIEQQSAEETPWWKSPWVIGAGVCAVIAFVSMSSDEDAKT